MDKILQEIEVLKKNEEHNTKREIKRALENLERKAEVIKRNERENWLIGEEDPGKEITTQTESETQDMITYTESEEERKEKGELLELIGRVKDYQEWQEIAKRKWKEQHYNQAQIQKKNSGGGFG